MKTAAKIIAGVLMLLFVIGTWQVIQVSVKMLFGFLDPADQRNTKEKLRWILLNILGLAVIMGVALGVAALTGILNEPW